MSLTVTTHHDEIRTQINRWVAADPVRATSFGSLASMLEDTAWAAFDAGQLAARSGAAFPLHLIGDWSASHVTELVAAVRLLDDLAGVGGAAEPVRAVVTTMRPDLELGAGQRLYQCDTLVPPGSVSGSAVRAANADRTLVRAWYSAFFDEVGDAFGDPIAAADRALDQDHCWLWHDGEQVVSVATARTPVGGAARIGPVYTPTGHRGRGYGSAVTAAATQCVLDLDAVPVLFTELSNPTSNKIYQQLGYRPVEDRLVVTLD